MTALLGIPLRVSPKRLSGFKFKKPGLRFYWVYDAKGLSKINPGKILF
jgi:hypothetical protein